MRKILAILLLLIPFIIWSQRTQDSLEIALKQIIAASEIPGLGVSIVGERGVLYASGFGVKDVNSKAPYDSLTVQPVASISKTILAVAVMKLVEQGKVDLEENVNTYLPFVVKNPNFPNEKITLLHLVTHSSSIVETNALDEASYFVIDRNYPKSTFPKGAYKYYKKYLKNKRATLANHLESHLLVSGKRYEKNVFSKHKPGEVYGYTNIGACLVAYVIERVAGQTFTAFTKEHIFNPLGMESTSWRTSAASNQATLYFPNGAKVPKYSLNPFPASGLYTNSLDMGRFLSDILNGYNGSGKLLKPASYRFMLSNQLNIKDATVAKGIFWDINREGNIGHDGGEIGTASQLIFSPALNKAFFLAINMSVYDVAHLERDFVTLLITVTKYMKQMN